MKSHWRKLLSYFPKNIERTIYDRFFLQEDAAWKTDGMPLPASQYSKQHALTELQHTYNLRVLVETGTYLGDTLYALYDNFDQLYSIELSDFFYRKAKQRFKKYAKITLYLGDSGIQLKQLIKEISSPALFWLDGHYSGGLTARGEKDCPVYEELFAIFQSPFNHIIVIDDARLFVGKNDYPSLLQLKAFVATNKPTYAFSLQNDSIRLTPAI